ncbi:hypothetical protein PSHT_08290 [Puccinia striiformis]|uniref:Uncharacterized protein n=2 Tax=Puccinia striiformis TaxID=27350 RepID=A0A2S4W0B7_9BASI|nr:hypothetical protein PSHT_08290 [Puccinia striiformis]POW15188.1 hypothetical protein PSTT_02448 [Puccinia striiformis]
MPFLDCKLEGVEARSTQFMNHNGIILSGVGTITKIQQSFAFGDKTIIVRYHLEKDHFKGRPQENLKVGQRGVFGGVLAGWLRHNRGVYVQP